MRNIKLIFKINIPVLLVSGIFFSCENSMEAINAASNSEDLPLQTITNGVFDYSEKGIRTNTIEAGKLNQYKNENIIVTEGLKMTMYDKAENIEAILTSKRGTYFKSENILTAKDSVRLKNVDGDVLFTEEITLYQDSDLIITNLPIEIHKGDNIIFGEGLTANTSFTKYQIKNPSGSKIVIPNDSISQNDQPRKSN